MLFIAQSKVIIITQLAALRQSSVRIYISQIRFNNVLYARMIFAYCYQRIMFTLSSIYCIFKDKFIISLSDAKIVKICDLSPTVKGLTLKVEPGGDQKKLSFRFCSNKFPLNSNFIYLSFEVITFAFSCHVNLSNRQIHIIQIKQDRSCFQQLTW